MTGAVLWYVHDHGAGHLARARAVIPRLRSRVVVAAGPGVAGAAARALDVPVVALPSDVPARPQPSVGPWHHAPACAEQRARAASLADAIARHGVTTAVVDVSMEVAVLCRLHGLRVVAVRQSGRRSDEAHRIGLASADVVWVPQHRSLEPSVDEADDRWVYTGAFSRFDGEPRTASRPLAPRVVALVVGAGGTSFEIDAWRTAAAPPGWRVLIVGSDRRWSTNDVTSVGRIDQVLPVLQSADVVVTSAGWAAVADTVVAGACLVVVPEGRPFEEQAVRADSLQAAGLARVLSRWPAPDELADVVTSALTLEPRRWCQYYDGAGAERAAALIDGEHRR